MALCIPRPELAQSASNAELRLLRALDNQLGTEFVVMHSVAWISKPGSSGPRDGETDILIAHPQFGLLVVEVKGGGISLDYRNQRWTSTNRNGIEHQIKNPFEQAKRGKFGILEKLKENPGWLRLQLRRFNLGHAAFFPDIGDGARLQGPDAPREIIGDRGDLERLAEWVDQAFRYWSKRQDGALDEIGKRGVEAIASIFARTATTRPLLSARIEDEEERRVHLTRRQATVLDMLKRQRRVMIAGGAGTGKTLIAREKAVRLANEGMQTLLVCFNRGLADHIREICTGTPGLDVASFHQICHRWIGRAKAELGRNLMAEARRAYPRANEFDQLMPIALANAVDALGPAYDAIVVDEGQDFGDEFWMPIEMLLTDPEQGILYVFLDENQDIYRRSASVPISGEPVVLDQNCRNTGAVHRAAYHHYRGAAVEPSEIEGVAVEEVHASDIDNQRRSIGALLAKLLVEEKISAHQIAILLCNANQRNACERALKTVSLPKGTEFGRLEDYGEDIVTVDTVARFKGLERDVIILWAFEDCSADRDRETLYVGMSRAKSVLYLCGSREACRTVLSRNR